MSARDLDRLIAGHVAGELTEEEHARLESILVEDPEARAAYLERLDLEAGLATWAAMRSEAPRLQVVAPRRSWRPALMAASVLFAALLAWAWTWESPVPNVRIAGTVAAAWADVDADGVFALDSGVAELAFSGGTNVVMNAPCRLRVLDGARAELLGGDVTVLVDDLAAGFLLETPEARIHDEGTEFGVSLREAEAEVHVFDGSVIWESKAATAVEMPERIGAGEARRYSRRRSGRGMRVPFGEYVFVRAKEARMREAGGDQLLAYEGFEYLAGRMRRGRSGFGWGAAWDDPRRGRGSLGEIVDAGPGNRRLRLGGGAVLMRPLETPLEAARGEMVYLGIVVSGLEPGQTVEVGFSSGAGRRRGRDRRQVMSTIAESGSHVVAFERTLDLTHVRIEASFPVELDDLCVGRTKTAVRVASESD